MAGWAGRTPETWTWDGNTSDAQFLAAAQNLVDMQVRPAAVPPLRVMRVRNVLYVSI